MNLQELKQQMPQIFENVKKDVKKIMGRHRAGLSLGLVEMGMFRGGFIGGMHFHPGTEIVMNKSPLKIILESQPYEIIWAYTYHILLHEYIHSLGVIDEQQCRTITLNISEEIFKDKNHPVLILARNGIGVFIPYLKIVFVPPERRPDGMSIEYVSGFDRESQSYFS
ncbi:MAG TPA: hypothetical protein VMV43_03415 [Candidatus Nanopelagicaceae bacterium]|nr:hypothetical protein [Candidatus Nanopelagicaceae bacterium]